MHQHTQRAHGRRLLARREIVRHVLGDLAADDRRHADVRHIQPQIAQHVHLSPADRAADVELALCVRGQLRLGMIRVAAHVAAPVAHAADRSRRSVAAKAQRHRLFFFLEQRPHHRRRRQSAAERGRHRFGQAVYLMRRLHDLRRIRRHDHRAAVLRQRAHQIGFEHPYPSFPCFSGYSIPHLRLLCKRKKRIENDPRGMV